MDTKLPVAVTVFILRSIKSFHCLTEDLLWSQIPIRIIIATAKIPTPPSIISRLAPEVTAGKTTCKITAISALARTPAMAPP